jgi:hypothetical protein
VPGEVLSQQEVQQRFSPDDFRALGEAVGEFAVRLARALDLGSFRRDIERPYGICAVDHELWLAAAVNGKADRLHKQGYTNLATVLGQLGREYQDLRRTGQLRPTIIVITICISAILPLSNVAMEQCAWRVSSALPLRSQALRHANFASWNNFIQKRCSWP